MTTPPASPAPRPQVPLAVIIAICAFALLLIPFAGLAAWKSWERAHPGEFTADPPFCELLTPETVHRLVPTSYGGRADAASCSWSAPREEGPNRAGVHLLASRLTEELAGKDLRKQRGDLPGWEKNTVADVPGVGEEAFVRYQAQQSGGRITAQVTFRRSNMVVAVAYTRTDGDREAARAGAVDAAREAAGRLTTAGRRGR
ncbi:hypothetical protein ACIGBH_12180 [Streptomyces sp. NPDC085929]|uniref:hypothetical protein n=1 Tax=Streptomyces sp. NPDC085929 TaxID=3365739 RepID=UPI0037D37FC7